MSLRHRKKSHTLLPLHTMSLKSVGIFRNRTGKKCGEFCDYVRDKASRQSNCEERQDEVCLSCNTECKWGWVRVFSCMAVCLCLIVCVCVACTVGSPSLLIGKGNTQSHEARHLTHSIQCPVYNAVCILYICWCSCINLNTCTQNN